MAYEIVVRHDGLHKYRVVRGATPWEAHAKADAQVRAWDEQWQRNVSANKRRDERHEAMEYKESRRAEAQRITAEADALREELQGILAHTLRVNDAIDWDEFLDKREFAEPPPLRPEPPLLLGKPELRLPERPAKKPGLLRRFVEALDSTYEEERVEDEEEQYRSRVAEAKRAYNEEVARYNAEVRDHNEKLRAAHQAWQNALAAWEARRNEFLAAQQAHNNQVTQFARRYQEGDPAIVQEYCELVLQRSKYPDLFPGDFEVRFLPQDGILLVDFVLPTPDTIPSVKSARYVASRDTIEETHYKGKEMARLYEQTLYQTALRTIHELYEADKAIALRSIVFSGWTRSVDAATGRDSSACILSVQAGRQDFLQVDLSRVDPKSCIRRLGGLVSANLSELLPVSPIVALGHVATQPVEGREEPDRAVEGRDIAPQEGHTPVGPSPPTVDSALADAPSTISCPNCGATFRLSAELRGKHVKCGSCGRKFHVPW